MSRFPLDFVPDRRDLALEAWLIAEADSELLIPTVEVKAWIDSQETSNPLPLPRPGDSSA
ncbi:MAG TPA: hypothetical protein VGM32_13460 [Rhodopila sp.]